MPAYDAGFFAPPAPLARVSLRNPATGGVSDDVPMLIDSGADVTLIPRGAAEVLDASVDPTEGYELVAFDGTTSTAPVVQLDLVLLQRTFRGRLLLIDEEPGILGRDILNHLALVLDGPNLTWDEHGS